MATSEIIVLANAIIAEISGSMLAYAPDFALLPKSTTKIYIAPQEEIISAFERGKNQVTRKIAILWCRKIVSDSEIEPVILEREAIRNSFFRQRLAGQMCSAAELTPFYDSAILREQKVLAAPLILTFQSFSNPVA